MNNIVDTLTFKWKFINEEIRQKRTPTLIISDLEKLIKKCDEELKRLNGGDVSLFELSWEKEIIRIKVEAVRLQEKMQLGVKIDKAMVAIPSEATERAKARLKEIRKKIFITPDEIAEALLEVFNLDPLTKDISDFTHSLKDNIILRLLKRSGLNMKVTDEDVFSMLEIKSEHNDHPVFVFSCTVSLKPFVVTNEVRRKIMEAIKTKLEQAVEKENEVSIQGGSAIEDLFASEGGRGFGIKYLSLIFGFKSTQELRAVHQIIERLAIEGVEINGRNTQLKAVDNTNNSSVGIRYKIPDFRNYNSFSKYRKELVKAVIKKLDGYLNADAAMNINVKPTVSYQANPIKRDSFSETDSAAISKPPGGIDLNSKNMGLDVAREGKGIKMSLNPAMIAEFQAGNFSGVVPVILRITPISSPLPLLGIQPGKESELMAKV